MKEELLQGAENISLLQQQAIEALAGRGWRVDYVAIRNQSDLQPASGEPLVILAAARLGKTRLLDNIEVDGVSFRGAD
jgi:pantoate--beta-alanine ligase